MRVAIIGATGLVGREMLEVLFERKFPITKLFLVASENSHGRTVLFNNKHYKIISLEDLILKNIDLAFFSAGSEVSKKWAPKLLEELRLLIIHLIGE